MSSRPRTRSAGIRRSSTNGERDSGAGFRYAGADGYERCKAENPAYAVENEDRGRRLNTVQMRQLLELLEKKGLVLRQLQNGRIRTDDRAFRKRVMTYDGMTIIANLICRWPRPRELAKLAEMVGLNPPEYYVGYVQLQFRGVDDVEDVKAQRRAVGSLIGTSGAHFVRLTRENQLLYMWLHDHDKKETTKPGEEDYRVYVYANSPGAARKACESVARHAISLQTFDVMNKMEKKKAPGAGTRAKADRRSSTSSTPRLDYHVRARQLGRLAKWPGDDGS